MPVNNKIILYYTSVSGASYEDYKIPPCAGKVTLELFGRASWNQCNIPLSGSGVGTTATQCSKSLLSIHRGRWYGKTQVTSANRTDSNIFGIVCNGSGTAYFKINISGYGAGGVKLPTFSSTYCLAGSREGDVIYPGGFHGRQYITCSATISCGKGTTTGYGAIFGGWGGDAGPRGPGGNGASAYTNDNYQISTTYYPGGGGGANGGSNANTSTAGLSVWNTPNSAGAGGSGGNLSTFYPGTYCNAASGSLGGYGGGKTTCGSLAGTANIPITFNNIYGTLTAYMGTKAPSGTIYNHVFSNPGVYQIYIPIGTTQIQVDVLGGGAAGNIATSQSAPGFTVQIGTNAGGGGGGYARSTLIRNFTEFGAVINVQVADRKPVSTCGTYKSSKVTIDGVLEAEAYTAYDVRGGGCFINSGSGWNANYARNGLTRIGGKGGAGYSTSCRGGGGGGASWYGGVGGTGGSAISNRTSGGGGGAASCGAAGSNGTTSASTTAGGIGGSAGTGYPSSGGYPGNGAFNNTTVFLYGRCGAGGGGGSTTCTSSRSYAGGHGGNSTYLSSAAVYSFCGYKTTFNCYGSTFGYVFGPGGGGGGGYGGTTGGNGGAGGLAGGGGGGGRIGYDVYGGYGLVIVSMTVNSALAASSVKFTTSTSHVQVI